MPKVPRPDRPPKPPRRPKPKRWPQPSGAAPCQLPHIIPPPRIEDYVAVWPPTEVVNAHVVWDTVKALGPDLLRERPEYYHFYSDYNYFDVPRDVLWFLALNSRTRAMPGSPTLVVADPAQLHPSTNIIETYPDGSALIQGTTGDCDSIAKNFFGEMKDFAATSGIGLELCIGKLSKSPNPHEQNWCISEGEFYMVEPKAPESTFMRPPTGEYQITKIEL